LAYASGVYDPEGECMVVFGGEQSGGALTNSVWLLHLATPGSESWTQVSIPTTPRPSPRKGCTAFWDAPNHRAIFIGGQEGTATVTYLNEVWALYLNGHTTPGRAIGIWEQLSPHGTGPAAGPSFGAAALDPIHLRAVVFGGQSSATTYSGTTHASVPPTPRVGTVARSLPQLPGSLTDREGHTALLYRVSGEMIVYGGRRQPAGTIHSDVHVLQNATSPGSESWTSPGPVSGAGPRAGHAAFLHPYTPELFYFIFGGQNSPTTYTKNVDLLYRTGNVWSWNPLTRPLVLQGGPVPPEPTPRAWCAAGFDHAYIRLIVFGGETAPGQVTDELWILTVRVVTTPSFQFLLTWEQITPFTGDNPPARKNGHVVMLDNHIFVLTGGEDGAGQKFDDTWMLFPLGNPPNEVWFWVRMPDDGTLPSARSGGAGFTRPGLAGAYLFGGNDGTYLNDFWGYRSLGSSTGHYFTQGVRWLTQGPTGLSGASVVYDERNQRAIFFGGRDSTGTRRATFAIHLFQPTGR
jgi:hypothetical protein